MINVAGGLTTYGPVGKTGAEGFDREIAINLKTAYLMSRAAVDPLARSQGRGGELRLAGLFPRG